MHYFVTEDAHFSCKIVHCAIFFRCIVGFVRWVYFLQLRLCEYAAEKSSYEGVYPNKLIWIHHIPSGATYGGFIVHIWIKWVCINSSPPSAAYMRQGIRRALVQIMAWRRIYLNQCCVIVNWTLRNKLQWNFNRNTKLLIHDNAFDNIVWEMAAILSRERWVKGSHCISDFIYLQQGEGSAILIQGIKPNANKVGQWMDDYWYEHKYFICERGKSSLIQLSIRKISF